MEQTSNSQLKKTLLYGTVLGFALVLLSFTLHVTHLEKNSWIGLLQYVFQIVAITIAIQCYRNRCNEGFISYGKAFGTGLLTVLWASIIVAIYTYISTKFIDPGIIENARGMAMEKMDKSGNDEQIELISKIYNVIFTPGMMAILTVVGMVFWGTILSLIIAAFMKKDKDIFSETE